MKTLISDFWNFSMVGSLAIVAMLSITSIYAQSKDTSTYLFRLKDKKELIGKIVRTNADTIVIINPANNEEVLSRKQVAVKKNLYNDERTKTKLLTSNVGFISDNAFESKKGSTCITNFILAFTKINYGLTDHTVIEGGVFLLPTIANGAVGFNVKNHLRISSAFHLSPKVGIMTNLDAGIAFVNTGLSATVGKESHNLTVGVNRPVYLRSTGNKVHTNYNFHFRYSHRPVKNIGIFVEGIVNKFDATTSLKNYTYTFLPGLEVYGKKWTLTTYLIIDENYDGQATTLVPFVGAKVPIKFNKL